MRFMKRCNETGCKELIERGQTYCEKHEGIINKRYNDHRNKYDKEYVDFYRSTKWRKLRESVIREQQYLCQDCLDEGIYEIGEELHHIIPTKTEEGWKKRLDREGLRFLCKTCHNKRTAEEQRRKDR